MGYNIKRYCREKGSSFFIQISKKYPQKKYLVLIILDFYEDILD